MPVREHSHAPNYDYQMMTDAERNEYREKMRNAKTTQERQALRDEHRTTMAGRMKERGVEPGAGRGGPGYGKGGGPGAPGFAKGGPGPGYGKGAGPRAPGEGYGKGPGRGGPGKGYGPGPGGGAAPQN